MNNRRIASEVRKILKEDTDKYLYRNLGTISKQLGISKASVLRAITSCKDIDIVFNEDGYNPNAGPIFALKECVRAKIKENRDEIPSSFFNIPPSCLLRYLSLIYLIIKKLAN